MSVRLISKKTSICLPLLCNLNSDLIREKGIWTVFADIYNKQTGTTHSDWGPDFFPHHTLYISSPAPGPTWIWQAGRRDCGDIHLGQRWVWISFWLLTLMQGKGCNYSVPQSLSCIWPSSTPWTTAWQASLSFTTSWSLLKCMSIESVMPSSHLAPFSFCLQSFPHQGIFQWVISSHQVAKVLELQLQHHSYLWIFKVEFL